MSETIANTEKVKRLVPKLRFGNNFYSDWEKRVLGEIVKSIKSGKSKSSENGSFPLYGSTGKIGSCLEFSHDGMFILIARVGANAGRTNLIEDKFGVSDNTLVVTESEEADLNFIFYFFKFYNLNRLIFGSGQPLITGGQLKKLKINLPSLPEQQKIATFLSAVDKKIGHLTRKKALLEQYKKGVMQQLFSRQLRFKDEKGRDFPEWEEKRLGEICLVNPKSKKLPSKFIYIDLESVSNGQLIKENKINLDEAPSRAQRGLEINDILYQTVRPYQKNNLFFSKKGDFVASTGYAQLRIKECPMFIYQMLHTDDFVNKVLVRCTGTSYPAINSTDLKGIKILIPCTEEQQKIADFLTSIDKKINTVTQQITKSQAFKKGLLQQLFV